MHKRRSSSRKYEEIENDKCLPFSFDLPQENLILVTHISGLQILHSALRNSIVIGIDTETQPHLRVHDKYPTALIQVASRLETGEEFVFIIDMLDISTDSKAMSELDSILYGCFTNQAIYKIGQGLHRDIVELHESYSHLKCFQIVMSILETNTIHKVIHPDILKNVSLKYLTRHYLHCNLIKSQQCSSWGSRPLTPSQIHYAASDALVLLRLYDAMCCELEELFGSDNVDIKSLLATVDVTSSSKSSFRSSQLSAASPSSPSSCASLPQVPHLLASLNRFPTRGAYPGAYPGTSTCSPRPKKRKGGKGKHAEEDEKAKDVDTAMDADMHTCGVGKESPVQDRENKMERAIAPFTPGPVHAPLPACKAFLATPTSDDENTTINHD